MKNNNDVNVKETKKVEETVWITDAVTGMRMTYEEFLELQESRRS